MKKIVLFSTLLFAILLTGCSSAKRVVCNQKVSVVDIDMIMDFKEDLLSYMGLQYTMDLSMYSDEQKAQLESQNLCSSVKTAMGTYGNALENCKQKTESDKLVITADFDIDKLPGAEDGKRDNIDDAIKSLEAQGYTCKK